MTSLPAWHAVPAWTSFCTYPLLKGGKERNMPLKPPVADWLESPGLPERGKLRSQEARPGMPSFIPNRDPGGEPVPKRF